MKVVLISGPQGSGKTTLQQALSYAWQLRHAGNVTFLNFADVIYEMHGRVLDVLNQYWPNRGLVKDGPLLQMLGTDWGRKTIDENIWVKILQTKVDRIKVEHPQALVIIGDCRFPNEFDAFPEGLRIRLDAPEKIRKARCSMWRSNTQHPSEIALNHHAETGKFDMHMDTSRLEVGGCVSLIMVALEKGDWSERRNNAKR